MSSISKENYLKTIYIHKRMDGENVSSVQLAHDLDVSNAAISDMAKKLSQQGLVAYEKYKGMELTIEGERIALNVIRRHRLWELFLIKVLGIPLSEVHDQAEILEHHTSETLIDRIDEFLEYPDFDPHGHPIPRKNGELPKVEACIMLAETQEGKFYKFVQINDRDNELINYLIKVGFLLNTEFEVIHKLEFDNSITIKFNDKILSFSKKISENVFVKERLLEEL